MKANRRILIIALALVWVAGLGVWGWAALGPDSAPKVEATTGEPSPTRGDVDDGFQNVEDICSKLDLTSLSTTTGLMWTEAMEAETSWAVVPSHSYGCHSYAPDHDTSITLSVGLYDAAQQAIREYDASLATLNQSFYEVEENIDASWSRSLLYSESGNASPSNDASYFVTSQADNLVLHARIVFGEPSKLNDDVSAVAATEILRIGEQIQRLMDAR